MHICTLYAENLRASDLEVFVDQTTANLKSLCQCHMSALRLLSLFMI